MKRLYRKFSTKTSLIILLSIFTPAPSIASDLFVDPMYAAAVKSPAPNLEPMLALSRAGDHWVAVGLRGMVIVSDSNANNWIQAVVPVQSDFVAVQFPDNKNGWICGHDGMILHSSDGGRSWVKQLDGIAARAEFENFYKKEIAAGDSGLTQYLQQIQLNFDAGPNLPWLSVWFNDKDNGYVVGSFGNIATTKDGGETWQPWLDHIDNPNFLDLNTINAVGSQLYIVGEQGSVYLFDNSKQRFVARPTGYTGSLFGITGTSKILVTYGMRGRIFWSEDQGRSWSPSANNSQSSISSGLVLADGYVVLVNIDGGILVSKDSARSFHLLPRDQNMPLSGIAEENDNQIIMTGLGGIHSGTAN